MALTRRGNIWYIDIKYKDPLGLPQRYQAPAGMDEREARRKEAEIKLAIRAGQSPSAPGKPEKRREPTVRDAFALCYTTRWGGRPDRQTWVRRGRDNKMLSWADNLKRVEAWEEVLGDHPLNTLTTEAILKGLARIKFRWPPTDATKRRYLSALNTALQVAYDQNLTKNLISLRGVRHGLKESDERTRVISQEEQKEIIDFLQARHQEAPEDATRQELVLFYQLLFGLGSRVGETLLLDKAAIDLKEKTAIFAGRITKSRRPRVLPIDGLEAVFEELLALRPADPLLFSINYHAVDYSWSLVRKLLNAGKEEDLVPHSIRHTVGTRLAKEVPLPLVQKMLGHASISTTTRYVHMDVQDLRDCRKIL